MDGSLMRRRTEMMYPYMTLFDGTEVVHSHLINEGENQTVLVHFERPTENGFDSARCEIPSYKWLSCEGFNEEEMKFFDEYVRANAHLFFKYAAAGGVQIA